MNIYNLYDEGVCHLANIENDIVTVEADLEALLKENGGEVTPTINEGFHALDELREQRETALAELKSSIKTKSDEYCKWLRNVESDIKSLKAEEERLSKRRKSLERLTDFIKENLLYAVSVSGEKSIKGSLFTLSVRKTKAVSVNEDTALAPYRPYIDKALVNLPSWLTLQPKINKSLAKKEDSLPLGFTEQVNESITIK